MPVAVRQAPGRRPCRRCGRVLRRQQVLEAVLAQAVVERRAVDAERARRVRDVALRCVDRGDDLRALLLVQALGERPRCRRSAARRGATAAAGGRLGRRAAWAAREVEVGRGDLARRARGSARAR